MKTRITSLLTLMLLATLNPRLSTCFAQGTAFTYQGRLTDNGALAVNIYDFQFNLFAVSSGGSPLTSTVAVDDVPVTNGLFIVLLDFGGAPFDGSARWLEVAVRRGNTSGSYKTVAPRQPVTATPYAITAGNLTGTVSGSGLSGTYSSAVTFNNTANNFTGNGAGLTALNANQLTSGQVPSAVLGNAWQITGNSGTTAGTHFLGTTDNQPLEIKVNGLRALRIELNSSGAPNVIGGSPRNFVAVGLVGATIGGGGATNFLGVPYTNSIQSDFGVVGGGRGNAIGTNSRDSAIGAGHDNNIADNSSDSTIAGGKFNRIGTNSPGSAIGGGDGNRIADNADDSAIAGGEGNTIGTNSGISTIGGGFVNHIAADSVSATIAGGRNNDIDTNSPSSTIGGGKDNDIAANSVSATIAGGVLNDIGSNSSYSAIGGGTNNHITANSPSVVIGGGADNWVSNLCSHAVIAGGEGNVITTDGGHSGIGGGQSNSVISQADWATIPGGRDNSVGGDYAFAAGRRAKASHAGAFVWGDSFNGDIASTNGNSVTMRASGGYRLFSDTGASAGVFLAAGGTSWAAISDRNAKKDFASVDSRAILEKLAALPITQWHYKWEEENITPHIGPVAQEFKAAFYPGSDDKSITTQEADGVALAAIQGLNQKLAVELKRRDAENAELRQRLEKLEHLLHPKAK